MRSLIIMMMVIVSLMFSSCKKDDNGEAEVSVYLQDAPAPAYEKIKINLKGVAIYSQASGSWVTLTVANGNFDLLTLDSMHQAFLGKVKISGGTISQLMLSIDNQNTVTVGGINYPLVLDASDLDKLKIKFDNHLQGGTSYKLTIDFKASESVDSNGGVYKLKASLKITVKEV